MEQMYKQLLERAWTKLPEHLRSHDRFEMPQADVLNEGNITIIRNFTEIGNQLRRDPVYILKFLSKELAAPGTLDGNRASIQRRLKKQVIQEKIDAYAKEYVVCHQCGRPDTDITSFEDQKIIKCGACGAWWPLRRIK
ncbi:Translation initiation factor 2 subunit beta [uncultured archaeon]|nr:Translation initiation factor 2 subunit beta [uncultured archaeon]